MTKVTVLRTKFFNDNLADKMLRARKNQMEHIMTNLSPRFQAIHDFNKGLNENPFSENSQEWTEYNEFWFDCYLVELEIEQQANYV